GADGRNIDDDTYEVARLMAACNALASGPRRPEPVTAEECTQIRQDFQEMRQENEAMLVQVKSIDAALDQIVALLKQQLGTDSLTADAVRSLTPVRNDVRQARQLYLQLAAQSISPQD